MSGGLQLIIATPAKLLADIDDVRSLRAEDDSGAFGVLPGHADLLTVLPPSVVRWTTGDGTTRYCARGARRNGRFRFVIAIPKACTASEDRIEEA